MGITEADMPKSRRVVFDDHAKGLGLEGGFLVILDGCGKVYSPTMDDFIQPRKFKHTGMGAQPISGQQANSFIRMGNLKEPLDYISKEERDQLLGIKDEEK